MIAMLEPEIRRSCCWGSELAEDIEDPGDSQSTPDDQSTPAPDIARGGANDSLRATSSQDPLDDTRNLLVI